jgi:hypothetical protein
MHFVTLMANTSNMTAAQKVSPQNQLQNLFEWWTGRWKQCTASQGEYLEGEQNNFQQ